MKSLMAEIKGDEAVFGSFIHHRKTGLVCSDLPTLFRVNKLTTYGNHIRRFFLLGESDGGFQGMEFNYGEMMVVSRSINKEYLLVTFCSPDANSQSVHLQQKVLLPELWAAINSNPPPQPKPQEPQEPQKVKNSSPKKQEQPLLFRGVRYEAKS